MAHRTKPKLSSRGALLLQRARSGKAKFNELADVIDEVMPFLSYGARREVLVDLANARGEKGIEWFWRKWKNGFRPETTEDLVELGDDLRRVWMFLNMDDTPRSQDYPARILNKWLAWHPTSEQLEGAYREWEEQFREGIRLLGIDETTTYQYVPFLCSTKVDRLIPNPNCLRAMLVQGVFEHWSHFSYCANSDCAAPYFIAKRKDQTVCDAEVCKAEKQREHARKWWNENRAKNVSAKKAKGRLRDGTGKTR